MDRLRVTQGTALRDLDRVYVADEVTDGRVRGRQLLPVTFATVLPRDRHQVAVRDQQGYASPTDRRVRVIVDLAAGHHRGPFVEQPHEGADQPGLALTALAEHDDVVPGQQRPLDLGNDGVVEADDARQRWLAGGESADQVLPDLGLDTA